MRVNPDPVEPIKDKERITTALRWGLILTLAAILSVTAFYSVFTGFLPLDDMGYVMLTQKTFFAGHALYDETFTQYGPAYYACKQLLLFITRLPLSHDSTLIFTALSWIGTSLLCAGYVARMTRNVLLTALTLCAVFSVVEALKNEPGHPQELCAVLLAGALFCGAFIKSGRYPGVIPGIIGLLLGLVAMTKSNIGVFATLSMLVSLSNMAPAGKARNILFGVSSILALFLPVTLMHHNLPEMAGYCVLESGAILFLIIQSGQSRPKDPLSWQALAGAPVGLISGVMACLVYAKVTGSSFRGIMNGLVLQHIGFDRTFFIYSPFGLKDVLLPLGLAVVVCLVIGARNGFWQYWPWMSGVLKIAAVPAATLAQKVLFVQGAFGHCLPLVSATAHLLPGQPRSLTEVAPRYFAVSLAVLSALWGYPVWGSQGLLSTFLLIPVWLVSCADAIRYGSWKSSGADMEYNTLPVCQKDPVVAEAQWRHTAQRTFYCATAVILLGLALFRARSAVASYWAAESLGLPGTKLLHIPQKQADFYRRLTEAARTHGRTFYSMPGLCSLYFWAEEDSPTFLNAGAWIILFKPDQQSKVVEDLQKAPEICIIRWSRMSAVWSGNRDMSQNKIVRYIEDNFSKAESVEECDILVRRQAGHFGVQNQNGH
jgi:hypothetical protein